MTLNRAFGFEAELGSEAQAVVRVLNERGLAGMDHLHHYHCDCEFCDPGGDWLFHAQSDSTCAGEIISCPFTSWEEARVAMQTLQDVLVECDAEIDSRAGFHVHVSGDWGEVNERLPRSTDLLFTWLPFEDWLLSEVVTGPLAVFRGGGNYKISTMLRSYMPNTVDERWSLSETATWIRHNDRHVTLNLTRSDNRPEFRAWNATRSAWRMEMFARLSVLFTQHDFVQEVSEWSKDFLLTGNQWYDDGIGRTSEGYSVDRDAALLYIEAHDPIAAELVRRHLHFRDTTPWLPTHSLQEWSEQDDLDYEAATTAHDLGVAVDLGDGLVVTPRRTDSWWHIESAEIPTARWQWVEQTETDRELEQTERLSSVHTDDVNQWLHGTATTIEQERAERLLREMEWQVAWDENGSGPRRRNRPPLNPAQEARRLRRTPSRPPPIPPRLREESAYLDDTDEWSLLDDDS